MSGQNVGLLAQKILTMAQGSYSLTGQNVTLTYSSAVSVIALVLSVYARSNVLDVEVRTNNLETYERTNVLDIEDNT